MGKKLESFSPSDYPETVNGDGATTGRKGLKSFSPSATVEKKIADTNQDVSRSNPNNSADSSNKNDKEIKAPETQTNFEDRSSLDEKLQSISKIIQSSEPLQNSIIEEKHTIDNEHQPLEVENRDQDDDATTINLQKEDDAFYDKLFIFERSGSQFAIPVQHVKEVIRDFGNIESLPTEIRGCIGSIIYREKLIPVFECADLISDNSFEDSLAKQSSLVCVSLGSFDFCFTMDKHIDVISSNNVLGSSHLREDEFKSSNKREDLIRAVVGFQSSNLLIIHVEKIQKTLSKTIGKQGVLDYQNSEAVKLEEEVQKSTREYIYSRIHDYHFVIDVQNVVEIIEGYDVTRIHDKSEFVRGLINLRGQVLACIDISAELGEQSLVIDERNKFIVLRQDQNEFALCVDEVLGIQTLDPLSFSSSEAVLNQRVSEVFTSVREQNNTTLLQLATESIAASENLALYR
jgi:purine-binding chemotaxis protein CheW